MSENEPRVEGPKVCTMVINYRGQELHCRRLLTNPCGLCIQYDKHSVEWDKIFKELAGIRVAVEGDI